MITKKTRFKFRPLDFFIVVFCVGVCVISLSLFWKDLNSSSIRKDKNQIATITFKHRVAQRKYSDRVVWERLQNETPLYNMDTIRTSDLADAVIRFNDGTVIDLNENSMIQISYTEESGVKLNVDGGNFVVDTSNSEKTVEISMGNGTLINLAAGSKLTAASNSQSGESSLQIQMGQGSVKNKEGTSQNIETGESVKIASGGELKKGLLTVTSISSDLRVLNFEKEPVPVHLEWNASKEIEDAPVIIETSRTKDFTNIEKTYTVTDAKSFDIPADDGVLYWRVYSAKEADDSVSGKVKVENVPPVEIKVPNNNTEFSYRSDLPQINFGWQGNEYVDYYRLEVSQLPDFSELVIDHNLSIQNVNYSRLEEGNYFWRVTPYYSQNGIGYAESSEIRTFTITKRDTLEPPVLAIPVENAKVVFDNEEYSTLFRWKSDVKKADYKVVVSTDENFENIVYEEDTKVKRLKSDFNSETMPEGNYYWKVVRNSSEDEIAAESEIRQFTVAKYEPLPNRLIYPPENFCVEHNKVDSVLFTWKLADIYKSHLVESVIQLSQNQDFEEVKEYKTSGNTLKNVKLEEGNYYWRVGVLDSKNNQMNFTESRTLEVLSELGIPQFTNPVRENLLVIDDSKTVNFRWNNVEGADYYLIKIFDENGRIINEISEIRDENLKINLGVKKSSKPQKIKASIQAFSEATDYSPMRISKQSSINFEVRSPMTVQLLKPASKTEFNGLEALRKPVELSWKENDDKAAYSQLVLKKVQPSGEAKIVQIIENPENTVSFERLTEGSYQWTVKAITKDGIVLDAEDYNQFTVLPVPLLKTASLSEPANSLVMGQEYLKKHRNLTFSWKTVNNATDYLFVLYQKTPEGLKKIYSEETIKNSVKIKDLRILDLGEFQWQVIAYNHAKDGFEEQHSEVAVSSFTIDFAKPKKIKTKDPGKLYAN